MDRDYKKGRMAANKVTAVHRLWNIEFSERTTRSRPGGRPGGSFLFLAADLQSIYRHILRMRAPTSILGA